MPSPFPGMDPYLESPTVWPDFHNSLAGELRGFLNRMLPPPYYAQLDVRMEVGWNHLRLRRVMLPDITVQRIKDHWENTGGSDEGGGLATAAEVMTEIRTELTPGMAFEIESEPVELTSVLIRDSKRDHEVVTALELVSPTNKRTGPDRDQYLKKRQDVLNGPASLVECDLLRTGTRPFNEPQYGQIVQYELDPQPDYLIAVNRAWERGRYQLFPTNVKDVLPVIPIPLREGEAEVPLDVQYVFTRAYDAGPYRRGAVDYTRDPQPPLNGDLAEWAREQIKSATAKSEEPKPSKEKP